MNSQFKQWLLISYCAGILLLAIFGLQSLLQANKFEALLLGFAIFCWSLAIAKYFYSPEFRINKLWEEVYKNTVEIKKQEQKAMGGTSAILKNRNMVVGSLINSSLDYYYYGDEDSEFVTENRYL